MLILFSDGISEARNAGREMFAAGGIAASLDNVEDLSAGAVLQTIFDQFESHIGHEGPGDDRTLLVLHFGG